MFGDIFKIRLLTLGLLCVLQLGLLAQKEYNQWFFGQGIGLNFNTNPPSPYQLKVPDYTSNGLEGSTSMCDSNGNLIFYTNGDSIFNSQHTSLKESIPIGISVRWSAIQSSMALPIFGKKNKYFLFKGVSEEGQGRGYNNMTYSVIDMNGDGGLGSMEVKDRLLPLTPLENFGITQHANGMDYWVACVSNPGTLNPNAKFTCIQTNGESVSSALVSQDLGDYISGTVCPMKFSPDAKKVLTHRFYDRSISPPEPVVVLYQFNNQTGKLSNRITISGVESFSEFSENGQFLYLHRFNGSSFELVQYDLSNWNLNAVQNSATVVYTFPNTMDITGLQLGPDRKIYIYSHRTTFLDVVHFPNKKGTSCNVVSQSVSWSSLGSTNLAGAPYYPSFWFANNLFLNLGEDTVICKGDSLQLTFNPDGFASWNWSNGEEGKDTLVVKATGTYWLEGISSAGDIIRDSINVIVGPKQKLYLGPDTAFCGYFQFLIDAGVRYKGYLWDDGRTTSSIVVDTAGQFSVLVTDSNFCNDTDTIEVEQLMRPKIEIFPDTINCEYIELSVIQDSGIDYSWSDGTKGPLIRILDTGTYVIYAMNNFCEISDTVNINFLPKPEINLGLDTVLCLGDTLFLDVSYPNSSYLWSNNSKSPNQIIFNTGQIWVEVTANKCSSRDTLLVTYLDKPKPELGNDTTLCIGKTLLLKPKGVGEKYTWNDNSQIGLREITLPGNYQLNVSNICGNAQDEIEVYMVDCDCDLYMPNSFTPNSDNLNEYFPPMFNCRPSSFDMKIYNRWGELLFHSTRATELWDGTGNNIPATQGVYLYLIHYIDLNHKRNVFSGTVTLLR